MPILFILLWSSGFLFVKWGLESNPPTTFLMLRLLFASVVMLLVLLIQKPQISLTLNKVIRMAVTGILIQGFYQYFSFSALFYGASPGVLAIILGTQPLATALILRECMSKAQWGGLALGLVGLGLTVSSVISLETNTVSGVICCFLALFGITLGTIFQKKFASKESMTINLFIQYFASFCLAFILFAFTATPTIHWSGSFIIALSWMVLVVSILSVFLFYYLLERSVIVNFTSYLYCVPPVTALLDYFVYHHSLSNKTMLGMFFVMAGLGMILKTKNQTTAPRMIDYRKNTELNPQSNMIE